MLRQFKINRLALGLLPRLVFARALRTFLPRSASIDADVRADFWNCFRRREVRAFITRMCAAYQGTLPLLPREYARISVPTLALWGELDAHFPAEHAVRLADQVRHAAVQVIPRGEHWMPLQMPDVFVEAVRPFLTG